MKEAYRETHRAAHGEELQDLEARVNMSSPYPTGGYRVEGEKEPVWGEDSISNEQAAPGQRDLPLPTSCPRCCVSAGTSPKPPRPLATWSSGALRTTTRRPCLPNSPSRASDKVSQHNTKTTVGNSDPLRDVAMAPAQTLPVTEWVAVAKYTCAVALSQHHVWAVAVHAPPYLVVRMVQEGIWTAS